MKHVVLYVGQLYKLFWTKKIDRVGRGGSKKAKIWPRMGLAFIYFWPRSLLEAPKWVKDPGNGLKSIRGSWGDLLGVFQGSLTHLGASRRLRGQRYIKARSILGHILTFFDPPCQPGQIFLVQNSLYRCPTYRTTCFKFNSHLSGDFRPSEVIFSLDASSWTMSCCSGFVTVDRAYPVLL